MICFYRVFLGMPCSNVQDIVPDTHLRHLFHLSPVLGCYLVCCPGEIFQILNYDMIGTRHLIEVPRHINIIRSCGQAHRLINSSILFTESGQNSESLHMRTEAQALCEHSYQTAHCSKQLYTVSRLCTPIQEGIVRCQNKSKLLNMPKAPKCKQGQRCTGLISISSQHQIDLITMVK